jgi:hypothetical protein
MRKITAPAATFALGLLLAGSIATAATTVATSSSAGLKACADTSGNLTLRVKGHCPHAKGVVISTASTAGAAGKTGATGAQGAQGDPGAQGVKGDTGAPGDVSNVYTQAAADARFAPLKIVGSTITLSGSDFHSASSTTGTDLDADGAGVFAVAPAVAPTTPQPPSKFIAGLTALPRNAVLQSVDFYVRHTQAAIDVATANQQNGSASVTVADTNPEDGVLTPDATTLVAQADADIQKITVSVPDTNNPNGLPISSSVVPQLDWQPAAASQGDEIYGATVHFTLNG